MLDRSRRPALLALSTVTLMTMLGACGLSAEDVPETGDTRGSAVTATVLRNGTALYPRLVRLEHSGGANGRIIAAAVLPPEGGQTGKGLIYESTDDGKSFSFVGQIADEKARRGICCSTLYELPQAVGGLPAGTLLWSASVEMDGADRRMSLPVWKSTDQGRSWSYLSDCVRASNNLGLWEPEFSVAKDGALVCHYSDETDPGRRSQKLMHARTYDGVNWKDWSPTVEARSQGDRPGMAVVRKMPDGTYFMSYEICGGFGCDTYLRTSPDGWNYGDPIGIGVRPQTPDGKFFKHAPTITLAPLPGGGTKIVLVGQELYNANGSIARDNGATLFVNTEHGTGAWYEVDAPVHTPQQPAAPQDGYCPNYSSALLPSADGKSLLELATNFVNGPCTGLFASGSLQGTLDADGLSSGSTYRLVNVASNMCLDIPNNTTSPVGMQQWGCNGAGAQKFVVTSSGNGVYTLKGADSHLCLDVANGSREPGAKVQQWECNGGGAQNFRLQAVGRGYYKLVSEAGGLCLDVVNGSRAAGAPIQQWTCNDLSPQIWKLERQDTAVVPGATYRLVNAASNNCLDVPAGTGSPAQLQQWSCNGLSPQNWVVTDAGDGFFALKSQSSGLCLDVDADSRAMGGKVQQWFCNGLGPQKWRIENAGDGYFTLKGQNSGMCLDVPGGTRDVGAKMQQWGCNGANAQRFLFERR